MDRLEETAHAIWADRKHPLRVVVTSRCLREVLAPLSDTERAPFDALTLAIDRWWGPPRGRLREVFDREVRKCFLPQGLAAPPPAVTTARQAATLLISSAIPFESRPDLPREDFKDADEEAFAAFIAECQRFAKVGKTQYRARLEHLVNLPPPIRFTKPKYPDLIDAADRMGWGRTKAGLGKLPKRLKQLAEWADLGAEWSWSGDGARPMITLSLLGQRRIAALDEEEQDALIAVIPWLRDAAAASAVTPAAT